MEEFGLGGLAGIGAAGAGLAFLGTVTAALRQRRVAMRASTAAVPQAKGRRGRRQAAAQAGRLEEFERAQAGLTARLDAMAEAMDAPDDQVQAMAGQVLELIRSRDAGLEELRDRIGVLEEAGDPAGAREAAEELTARLGRLREELANAEAAAPDAGGAAGAGELAERLAGLHEQKEAALEAVLARFAPLEKRLSGLETGQGALPRLEREIAGLRETQGKAGTALTGLQQATRGLGALTSRLEALERARAAQDPKVLFDRFSERLEALRRSQQETAAALGNRMEALETPEENPFAEISGRLAELYAQKDATVETVFARLAPLEAKLSEMEEAVTATDPAQALDGLKEEQRRQGETVFARLDGLKEAQERQDGAVEALTGRLAQISEEGSARGEGLRGRMEALERDLAARDPAAMLARFGERLETVQSRMEALETPEENPFAEISGRLAELYAQKDATVETVFARLAPLEAKLSEMEEAVTATDPAQALDGLKEEQRRQGETVFARLDGLKEAQERQDGAVEALTGRLAQISEEGSARGEGLRGRMEALERDLAARDPAAMLARFGERLETVQSRMEALETPEENPFAEISGRLAELYAQKDATVETVFARLAPLEAKLSEMEEAVTATDPAQALDGLDARLTEMETGMAMLAPLAGAGEQIGTLTARIDALDWAQEEVAERLLSLVTADGAAREQAAAAAAPFADVAERLAELYGRKEAGLEAVLERLAPVEARLAAIEQRPWDPDADEARAQAQAIAAQMIAAQAAAEQTGLFADRLALLEASLPRLSEAQSVLMHSLEMQAAGEGVRRSRRKAARPAGLAPGRSGKAAVLLEEPGPESVLGAEAAGDGMGVMAGPDTDGLDDSVWNLPQLVSLHRQ